MNVSAGQVRAATRAAAAVITPDSLPPLWLDEAPQSRGRARRPPMAWAVPLAAAAAVAVVVVGSVAAGSWLARSANGRPGALTSGAGGRIGAVPAYYVALGNPSYAAVRATATGATLAKIRTRIPFVGVTGAADDRTFVLDAQRQVMGPTVRWPGQPALYLLRLSASGTQQSLTRLAIPALPKGTTVTGLALSPDGSKLAVAVDSAKIIQPGWQEIMIDTLATGTVRTWSATRSGDPEDPGGFTGSGVDGSQTISWTAGSTTLAFDWQNQSVMGVRLLDTSTSGGNLITDSRLAVILGPGDPAVGAAVKAKDQVSQCVTDAIITPDGSAIICGYSTTTQRSAAASHETPAEQVAGPHRTTTGFIRYSARTGKVTRVFGVFQFKYRGQAPGVTALSDSSLYWTDPAGNILIGSVMTPGEPGVGVIHGNTFTPLPKTAGLEAAAW